MRGMVWTVFIDVAAALTEVLWLRLNIHMEHLVQGFQQKVGWMFECVVDLFRDIKGFGVAGKCQNAGVTHVLEAFAFLLKEGGVVKRRSQKPSLVAWCYFIIF